MTECHMDKDIRARRGNIFSKNWLNSQKGGDSSTATFFSASNSKDALGVVSRCVVMVKQPKIVQPQLSLLLVKAAGCLVDVVEYTEGDSF